MRAYILCLNGIFYTECALAGIPITLEFEGTFFTTTDPAAIMTLSPISTPGKIRAHTPINTSLPIDTGV